MIHWGWLIAAGILGAVFGVFITAMCAASAYAELELAHFEEIRRLVKERPGK